MKTVKQSSRPRPNDYIGPIDTRGRTLTELFTEANEAGWAVNNLFQWGEVPMIWRCNLRQRFTDATEFCDADTPEEAVAGAILNMRGNKVVPIDKDRRAIHDACADL